MRSLLALAGFAIGCGIAVSLMPVAAQEPIELEPAPVAVPVDTIAVPRAYITWAELDSILAWMFPEPRVLDYDGSVWITPAGTMIPVEAGSPDSIEISPWQMEAIIRELNRHTGPLPLCLPWRTGPPYCGVSVDRRW